MPPRRGKFSVTTNEMGPLNAESLTNVARCSDGRGSEELRCRS